MLSEHDINDSDLNKEYDPITRLPKVIHKFTRCEIYLRMSSYIFKIATVDTEQEASAFCKAANAAQSNYNKHYYYILRPRNK